MPLELFSGLLVGGYKWRHPRERYRAFRSYRLPHRLQDPVPTITWCAVVLSLRSHCGVPYNCSPSIFSITYWTPAIDFSLLLCTGLLPITCTGLLPVTCTGRLPIAIHWAAPYYRALLATALVLLDTDSTPPQETSLNPVETPPATPVNTTPTTPGLREQLQQDREVSLTTGGTC